MAVDIRVRRIVELGQCIEGQGMRRHREKLRVPEFGYQVGKGVKVMGTRLGPLLSHVGKCLLTYLAWSAELAWKVATRATRAARKMLEVYWTYSVW